jgi:hypothetical protein
MYTVQYIVYSKHQHPKIGVSSWAAGISWQRGGMEPLGVSSAAACSWVAGRAGGGVNF